MRERLQKKIKGFTPSKGLLIASIGLNLLLGGWIGLYYFQSEILADADANTSYQDILANWRPFAVDEEPTKTPSTEVGEESPATPEEEPETPTVNPNEEFITENDLIEETPFPLEEEVEIIPSPEEDVESLSEVNGFSIHPISESLQATLEELSPLDPSVMTYEDLRLVKVLYWGFDNQTHMGELIVNQVVASEVMEIFEEVYAVRYPIEKIRLISEYQNSDEDSMRDNNTSCFNYREVTAGSSLSMHAYGLAIDINPKMNPYVTDDYVLPDNAMAYVDRDQSIPGMIQAGDALHQAFTSRGWTWGGDWTHLKDYQHFSKTVN